MDEQNAVATAAAEETQTQSAAEATAVASAQNEAAATAKAAEAAVKADVSVVTDVKTAPDDKAASEEEAGTARAREIAALQRRLAEAELRGAAALAGVPREKVAYVARMADVSGIDMGADNARELIDAAVARVLGDVPELRGGSAPSGASPAGTGGAGNFARRTCEGEDPDIARIRRNILGVQAFAERNA